MCVFYSHNIEIGTRLLVVCRAYSTCKQFKCVQSTYCLNYIAALYIYICICIYIWRIIIIANRSLLSFFIALFCFCFLSLYLYRGNIYFFSHLSHSLTHTRLLFTLSLLLLTLCKGKSIGIGRKKICSKVWFRRLYGNLILSLPRYFVSTIRSPKKCMKCTPILVILSGLWDLTKKYSIYSDMRNSAFYACKLTCSFLSWSCCILSLHKYVAVVVGVYVDKIRKTKWQNKATNKNETLHHEWFSHWWQRCFHWYNEHLR